MKFKAVLFFFFFCSVSVFAASSQMPWDDGLTKVMNALSGSTTKIIGVILIIGAGVAMAATEGQAMKKLFWVIMGIGIALNAVSVATMLFGSSAGALI
jgi:type IV secretion system protein VirB2